MAACLKVTSRIGPAGMRRCVWPLLLWSIALLVYLLVYSSHHHSAALHAASHTGEGNSFPRDVVQHRKYVRLHLPLCNRVWENPEHSRQEWKSLSESLEVYRYFHHRQRQVLRKNISHGVHTLTWSCLTECSGLGDQLQQIALALILSILSHRVFLIHWETQYWAPQQLHPNQIDWTPPLHLPQYDVHPSAGKNVSPSLLTKRIFSSTPHLLLSNEIGVPFYRSFVKLKSVEGMEVRFQRLGLVTILKSESCRHRLPFLLGTFIRFLFNISRDVLVKFEQAQESIGLREHEYVAVHIRTGFLGSLHEQETGRFNRNKILRSEECWSEVLNCSLELAEKVYGEQSVILLVTDSLLVRYWARTIYGSKVVTPDHMLHHSGNLDHLEDSEGASKYDGVWIDALLMARAGFLVRGVSGYSMIAGAFCSLPLGRQCTLTCKCRQHYVH